MNVSKLLYIKTLKKKLYKFYSNAFNVLEKYLFYLKVLEIECFMT